MNILAGTPRLRLMPPQCKEGSMADIPITNNKTPILQEPALLSLCQIIWCSPHIHHNVVVCRIICAVAVCIATVYIFCTLSSYKLEMFNLIWTKQSGCRTTYCLKKPSQYVCCFSQDPFGSCGYYNCLITDPLSAWSRWNM